jgi:hypothetical protein
MKSPHLLHPPSAAASNARANRVTPGLYIRREQYPRAGIIQSI